VDQGGVGSGVVRHANARLIPGGRVRVKGWVNPRPVLVL